MPPELLDFLARTPHVDPALAAYLFGSLFELRLHVAAQARRIPTPVERPPHPELRWLARGVSRLWWRTGAEQERKLNTLYDRIERLPDPLSAVTRGLIGYLLTAPLGGLLHGNTWDRSWDVTLGIHEAPDGTRYLMVGTKNHRASVSHGLTNTQRPGFSWSIPSALDIDRELFHLPPVIDLGFMKLTLAPSAVTGPAYLVTGSTEQILYPGRATFFGIRLSGQGQFFVHGHSDGVQARSNRLASSIGVAPFIGASYHVSFPHLPPIEHLHFPNPIPNTLLEGVRLFLTNFPGFIYCYAKPGVDVKVTFPHQADPTDLLGNLRALVDPRARAGINLGLEVRGIEVAGGVYLTPNPITVLRLSNPYLALASPWVNGLLDVLEETVKSAMHQIGINWNINPEIAFYVSLPNIERSLLRREDQGTGSSPPSGPSDRMAPMGQQAASAPSPTGASTSPSVGQGARSAPAPTGIRPPQRPTSGHGRLRTTPLHTTPPASRPIRRPHYIHRRRSPRPGLGDSSPA
ncbi:MAG TPA: hypothetical protein VFD49_06220 [Candidatus Dormibacteraeota bacterium]|nr:hypothetical protein [Candidatus Dormibacteraeota bacterium]